MEVDSDPNNTPSPRSLASSDSTVEIEQVLYDLSDKSSENKKCRKMSASDYLNQDDLTRMESRV